MAVSPVPEGFHTLTPYLLVPDVRSQLDFCDKAFGSEVMECVEIPDGPVAHAQIRIGDSPLMMGMAQPPEYPAQPAMLYVYVTDCDATFAQALAAGGEVVRPLTDELYGDRSGGIRDPNGNTWWISTRKEDLSSEEIAARMASQGGGH